MPSTIVLIMNMDSRLLFESLARCTAVWIADTPAHSKFKNTISTGNDFPSITWFPLHSGEALETAAVRICFSLDDHFNEDAQAKGYESLLVFGANHEISMKSELAPLGFRQIESTSFGFVASK